MSVALLEQFAKRLKLDRQPELMARAKEYLHRMQQPSNNVSQMKMPASCQPALALHLAFKTSSVSPDDLSVNLSVEYQALSGATKKSYANHLKNVENALGVSGEASVTPADACVKLGLLDGAHKDAQKVLRAYEAGLSAAKRNAVADAGKSVYVCAAVATVAKIRKTKISRTVLCEMASCSKSELDKLITEMLKLPGVDSASLGTSRKRSKKRLPEAVLEEEDLDNDGNAENHVPKTQKRVISRSQDDEFVEFNRKEYESWKRKMLAIAGIDE